MIAAIVVVLILATVAALIEPKHQKQPGAEKGFPRSRRRHP